MLSDFECKEGGRDTTIIMGEIQNTPMSCAKEGYERIAKSALAPRQGDIFYVKVKCVPRDMSRER
jgi:hypothetical protein